MSSSTVRRLFKKKSVDTDSETASEADLRELLVPGFVALYDKFEAGYLKFRDEVNRLVDGESPSVKNRDELVAVLQGSDVEWRFDKFRKEVWEPLGAMVLHMSKDEKALHVEYVSTSKAHLYCQESPFCWRIIQQPDGYVGDAEMMNLIYRNEYEGSTPFGMLVHKNSLQFQASQAVRNRKEYLKTVHIAPIIEGKAGGGTANILSMAAGPSAEIVEYLEDNPTVNANFLALDHDINTIKRTDTHDSRLRYAVANAFAMIKGKSKIAYPRMSVDSLDPRQDFKGYRAMLCPLKYKIQELKDNQYDLVYSAGLYDYIETFESSEKGTKSLTKVLFSKVKPGGRLVIGNFNPSIPNDEYFGMEIFTDWSLIFRKDEQVKEFLDGVPGSQIKSVRIDREPTGINSFLVVQKSQDTSASTPNSFVANDKQLMKKRLDNLYLIGTPLACSIYWLFKYKTLPFTWLIEGRCFLLFYALVGLSVGLGFHRCFTHQSYLPSRPLKLAMLLFGSMSLQGSVVRWVADHRHHHRYSDKRWDMHSPYYREGEKFNSLWAGILHAHFSWMFDRTVVDPLMYAPDLLEDPDIGFFDRYYNAITLLSFVFPAAFGYWMGQGSMEHAWSCLLVGGALRTSVFHQVTWSVNSLGHVFGSRDATKKDSSRNNWFLAILTFGEGWHNNHHALPRCGINQWKWYQIDMGGWILLGLQAVGLISELRGRQGLLA